MNNIFNGKTTLISGGSSGIGLALAKQLAGLGANIWLLARNRQRLESACEAVNQSKSSATQNVLTISADVANYDQLRQALSPVLDRYGAPDILVNSAGVTHPSLFDESDLEIHQEMMAINYFGTLHVTRLVQPGMKQRRSGHIINISSLVGLHGIYGYSTYAPSKAAVVTFSDALRYELKPHGVKVSVVLPTDTLTPQLEYENKFKPPLLKVLMESNNTAVTPESVADRILKAAARGKYLILPTNDGQILYFIYRLLPGDSFYRFVDYLMYRARRKMGENGTRH